MAAQGREQRGVPYGHTEWSHPISYWPATKASAGDPLLIASPFFLDDVALILQPQRMKFCNT